MTTQLKEIATRLRRQTRQADVLALCDGVLSMREVMPSDQASIQRQSDTRPQVASGPPGACPVCEARRRKKAAAMKRYRRRKERGGA